MVCFNANRLRGGNDQYGIVGLQYPVLPVGLWYDFLVDGHRNSPGGFEL